MARRLLEVKQNPATAGVASRLEYVKSEIARIFQGDPALTETIQKLVGEWTDYLSQKKSDQTIYTYLSTILYLFEFMKQQELNLDLPASKAMMLPSFIPKEKSSTTKNIALYSARSFFKFLAIAKDRAFNPFADIEGVTSVQHLVHPLSEKEYESIYTIMGRMRTDNAVYTNTRFLEEWELNAWLLLMNSGMRSMELMPLEPRNFDRDEHGNLTVVVMGKGQVQRMTIVSDVYDLFYEVMSPFLNKDHARVRLEDYLWDSMKLGRASGRDERLFEKKSRVVQEGKVRVVKHGVTRHILFDLMRWVNSFPGLVEKKPNTDFTLHQFRHTYATWMLNHPRKPLQLEQVKELLGHKSIATTLIYARVSLSKIQSAVAEQRK